MVKDGQVRKKTLDQLHMELISDEEYMDRANQYWDERLDQAD